MRKSAFVIAAFVLFVSAAGYAAFVASGAPRGNSARLGQSTPGPSGEDIPTPSEWVPFEAQMEKTVSGRPSVVGRFYRWRDGSKRSEMVLEGTDRRLITIINVGSNTYYEMSGDGVWCSHPMKVGKEYLPPKMRKNNSNGLQHLTATVEGFEVYRLTSDRRIVELSAPALNFFPLVQEDPVTGTRARYFGFKMNEPDPDLLVPPAAAAITIHSDLRGIVNNPTAAERPNLRSHK